MVISLKITIFAFMRVYLKNGKTFKISQALAEKLIDKLESEDKSSKSGNLVYVKELFNGGLSSKLVLVIDMNEVVAIK